VKRKTYYAHAMCIYGHLVESQELAAIRRRFKGSVVNPAKYDDDPEKRRDTIGFCLRLIERCDVIVFSKLLGKITAGVGKEINHALKLKKPVYELCDGKVSRRIRPVRYLTRTRTITLYGKWRKKYLG
jgi:hypothetical protein